MEGKRVALIATDGFKASELTEPLRSVPGAGALATVVAPQEGAIRAIGLLGGAFNADQLRRDETLRGVLQDFDALGKPIAAICHAPWILVSAGLVKGRTLTKGKRIAALNFASAEVS